MAWAPRRQAARLAGTSRAHSKQGGRRAVFVRTFEHTASLVARSLPRIVTPSKPADLDVLLPTLQVLAALREETASRHGSQMQVWPTSGGRKW